MSAMILRLPDSLHKAAKELSHKEHISVNQLVATALAEKMSALMTEEYLEKRAKKASKKAYFDILSRVPDIEPADYDKMR